MHIGALWPRRSLAGRPPSVSVAGRPARDWPAWFLPSFADMVFLACLLVALRSGGVMLSADGDPARHLVVGEHILRSGSISHQDDFSYTMAGQPFVPYEWLAEVAGALAYRLAGLAGLILMYGAVIGLTFASLFRQLRSRGHAVPLALAVTLLAVAASSAHWLARPHVFTFLGTAVFSAVLDGWHAGRLRSRWLWTLPPAMALWANAHGGFLIGLVLVAAYAAADGLRCLAGDAGAAGAARRRLVSLLPPAVATLSVTALNPVGPALLTHVTGYFGKQLLVDRTMEYRSPNFHSSQMHFFLAMLLAITATAVWSRRRPSLQEGLLLVGFTYFALYAARNIPLFAIVVAPLLAAQAASASQSALQDLGRSGRLSRPLGVFRAWLACRNRLYEHLDARLHGHLWPVMAVASLLTLALAQRQVGLSPLGLQFEPAMQPVAAAAYLRANPPVGNGFNELAWGGYLLRELWPAQRVFIDGQTDFYGEALAREYLNVVELEAGWESVLDRYGVQWLIYPTNSPLVRHLAASSAWQVAYVDKVATVLTRDQEHGRGG